MPCRTLASCGPCSAPGGSYGGAPHWPCRASGIRKTRKWPYTLNPRSAKAQSTEFCTNAAWTGTDQVRFYKLEGDTLTITTAPYKSYADEQEGRSILVWKKVQ
ncbi:MAG TPA: lipocalin-like domain-containing protein [Beijerinckiaceae bacterium]|nr:lipocalin-like domain-containing protein [Beijerinckiaceae bacterium]